MTFAIPTSSLSFTEWLAIHTPGWIDMKKPAHNALKTDPSFSRQSSASREYLCMTAFFLVVSHDAGWTAVHFRDSDRRYLSPESGVRCDEVRGD
jgi:hypothetical protein